MSARRGITIVELIVAMVVGLVVLGTVVAYVGTTDRSLQASTAREDYARKARFLGFAFRRDLGEAGTGIESYRTWGTVSVSGDTVSVLKVRYAPTAEPSFPIIVVPASATATSNTMCGNACFLTARGGEQSVEPGMVARVQVSPSLRRLVVVSTVTRQGQRTAIAVRSADSVLHRASVTRDAPLTELTPGNTFLQALELVAYWRDAQNQLWRATRLDPSTGALDGEVVATGVVSFQVRVLFADGTVGSAVNAAVAGRRYTDVNGIRITATLESDLTDARINDGQPLRRTYTWLVQPRNLLYERSR